MYYSSMIQSENSTAYNKQQINNTVKSPKGPIEGLIHTSDTKQRKVKMNLASICIGQNTSASRCLGPGSPPCLLHVLGAGLWLPTPATLTCRNLVNTHRCALYFSLLNSTNVLHGCSAFQLTPTLSCPGVTKKG